MTAKIPNVGQGEPIAEPDVEVRRSSRRTRTVSAFREGPTIVVAIPARFSRKQEREWVEKMVERLARKEAKTQLTDADLQERAVALSKEFLDSRAEPRSVVWVTNQKSRWGSCTPADGSIRLSDRLQGMPAWVIDYVLLHELVHLIVPSHGPEFWALVDRNPKTERARGFLDGFAYAHQREPKDPRGDD